ncbi:MAG TPA: methyltransferase domain-containing protein [Polyangiaceae bacterium]|nr:methyltransferase domain-containing protein [Polyangiaceae bacterium]
MTSKKAPRKSVKDPAPAAGSLLKPFTIYDVGYATDVGATAHYADPRYYSKTYGNRRHDVDYYVQRARLAKGPVLEYGVGNGRIALHMARAGVAVTGVDLSRAMLADFERRLALEPRQVRARVKLEQGDMREVRLERRFPLVIAPFNAILHLYDRRDVEAFLLRVREHLAEDGQFVFDFSIPQPEDLIRDPERAFATTPLEDGETGEPVSYAERFEYDPLRQLLLVRMELEHKNSGRKSTIPLTHRQYFPREMEALLHYNGFREILFTADFTDQPADRHVDSLVVACRSTPV